MGLGEPHMGILLKKALGMIRKKKEKTYWYIPSKDTKIFPS